MDILYQQIDIGVFDGGTAVNSVRYEDLSMTTNTWYDIKLYDSGSIFSLYFNGATIPTLSFDYSPYIGTFGGDKIGLFGRENKFGDQSASMDYVKISTVPEPSMSIFIFGLLFFIYASLKKIIRRGAN